MVGHSSKFTFSLQEVSTIGPSYERFRALTSQLKTSVSKRNAHPTQGADITVSGGDSVPSISGDLLDTGLVGGVGIGKSLRKGNAGGQGGGGGGPSGNIRSTRRAAAAAVAAAGAGILGIAEKEDSKSKLTQFGFPLDHPLNTENYRLVCVRFAIDIFKIS